MKFSGTLTPVVVGALVLLASGCRSAERPAAPEPVPSAPEGRDYADRLRVDKEWHPPATGGECVSWWYDLPPGAYVAQGWCFPCGYSPWATFGTPGWAPWGWAPQGACGPSRSRGFSRFRAFRRP